MKELSKTIDNLKRRMMNSRSRVVKKLEYEKNKKKKKDKEEMKTQTDMLNDFKRENTFYQTRHCCVCKSNFTDSKAEELMMDEMAVDVDCEMEMTRRFEKYWVCFQCKETMTDTCNYKSTIDVKSCIDFPRQLYLPQLIAGEESLNISQDYQEIVKQNTCLMPCSIGSLNYANHSNVKSRSNDVSVIHNSNLFDENTYGIIYEHEMFKYKRAKLFGDRYQGDVDNDGRLKKVEISPMDFFIVGSDSWKNYDKKNTVHRFEQFGSICLSIRTGLK